MPKEYRLQTSPSGLYGLRKMQGLIIASLLVDFLNVMKLENTLNVLMHEAQMKHLDLFDSDKLRSLLTPERTSSNSPLLLNLVETLKHFRNLKLDDTDSSPSVSNNSRNNSRSQVSDETLYSPSRIGNSFSKMKEVSNTLQEAPQETSTNYGNRLQMRTTVTGSLNSPRPSTPTSPTSSNIGKTESPGRASSGASSPSVVRVYAPVKKQLSLNDDKSDVDDDDDIEEVLKAEESVADDTVDQTVDSEQSLGLDYVEEVQALQNPV
ncbi:FGFR1 oncogene partner [Schistosoma japonicum]|nr:FGFR1 oncogene partner [Schistosoma japonicum]